MSNLTEPKYPGEWLVSEGNGQISRDTMILIAGQKVQSGDILGKITASGKLTALAPAAADGSQTGFALAYQNTDASATGTNADTKIAAVTRLAEVNGAEIGYSGATGNAGQITQAQADLAARNIIVRAAV